jgi:hypothetical protein
LQEGCYYGGVGFIGMLLFAARRVSVRYVLAAVIFRAVHKQ